LARGHVAALAGRALGRELRCEVAACRGGAPLTNWRHRRALPGLDDGRTRPLLDLDAVAVLELLALAALGWADPQLLRSHGFERVRCRLVREHRESRRIRETLEGARRLVAPCAISFAGVAADPLQFALQLAGEPQGVRRWRARWGTTGLGRAAV